MKVVSYIRVSTQRQGKSGLGLSAQETAVREFAAQHGAKIVGSFVEVERGRDDERPELSKAIAFAKRQRATLIVAKLDRLARSVRFVATLMEANIEFAAVDMPFANRLTLHIMSAVAEDEARRISERTKLALRAYKRRGGLLGASRPECRNLTAAGRRRGAKRAAEVNRASAVAAYADLAPMMRELREAGLSLRGIADRLYGEGHTTRRGKPWNPTQVLRVLG